LFLSSKNQIGREASARAGAARIATSDGAARLNTGLDIFMFTIISTPGPAISSPSKLFPRQGQAGREEA
jgi:hypothetical protein